MFDGFSIGSNDLTQLTLGMDRDSPYMGTLFDENDKAAKKMISLAIEKAQKTGKKIGLCGQAPSDFPEFASFLVNEGLYRPLFLSITMPCLRASGTWMKPNKEKQPEEINKN